MQCSILHGMWLSDKHKQTAISEVNDYGDHGVLYKFGWWHFETFDAI